MRHLVPSHGELSTFSIDTPLYPRDTGSDVVARVHRHGLMPPVLTNNLSVTVGGTLSVAGIGVASFKYGAQTDNVEELEVATVDGEVHRCSRQERSELFWGVLSGLGQIAIILRAKLRLRAAKSMTRTWYLLYDDVRRFMEDARLAMDSGKWDYLESWCAPCPQYGNGGVLALP